MGWIWRSGHIISLIEQERPDAILHYTDPRFWGWLYNIEHQITTKNSINVL